MNVAHKFVFWLDKHTSILEKVEIGRARWFVRRFGTSSWFKGNERVLDIGCGVGDITGALTLLTKSVVVGIDIEDFRRSGVRSQARFRFLSADAENLPFKSGEFGAVTVFWVLHHSERPNVLLAEAMRVLAPGGQLLIMEDVVDEGDAWGHRLTQLYDFIINLGLDRHRDNTRSLREWDSLVRSIGPMEVIELRDEPMFPWGQKLKFGVLRYRKMHSRE